MALRAVVSFLILAAVWTVGIPGRVGVDPSLEPEWQADAIGLPEAFDAPTPGTSLGVDPEPHRAAIDRIEAVLYRRSPAAFGDADAVESAALGLADAVMRDGGLQGRRAGMELVGFAGRVGASASAGYSLPSVVSMRDEWETVRGNVFAPAAWMRTASADLDRIQEPPPPPPDPRTDAVIAEVEAELRRLMVGGRRKAELLGEPEYDPDRPTVSDKGQIQAWYRFGERYRRQLADAMAPLATLDPQPDFTHQPLRAEAIRSLQDAERMLAQVPSGAGMWPTPFRGAWESRFEAANVSLARAREQMAEATGTAAASAEATARWDR